MLPKGLGEAGVGRQPEDAGAAERFRAEAKDEGKGGCAGACEKLEEMTVVVKTKAGEGGTLFGAITSKQIAEALAAQGVKVDKRKIELEEPIRTLGVTQVPVKLHPEVKAKLSVQAAEE